MRTTLAFLFGACLCMLPVAVNAAALRPPLNPSKCPSGSSTEVLRVKSMLLTRDTDPNAAKKFLQSSMYCPNACYDLYAKMTLTYTGLQVDISATHVCTSREKAPNDPAQSPRRGCAAGETQPRITIETKDVYSSYVGFKVKDQTVRKSRCDGEGLDSSVNKFFEGLSKVEGNAKGGEQQMQAALDEFRTRPEPQPEPLSNQEALTKALTATGVSEEKAKEIVKEDPKAAATLLSNVASGNEKAIEESKRMLELNDDITLDPKKAQAALNEKAEQEKQALLDEVSAARRQTTGFDDDELAAKETEKKERISSELESYVDGMRGHGCANGNLSCRTNNPGAMRYSSWMQQYGGYSCGQSNDAACFPSVEAGLAAKIDLVQRRMAQGCDTIYTLLENCQYAARNAGNDSWAYAMTVGRMTGFGPNGKIDPQNAEQMGRLVTAMAWYEGGRGIGFNGEQLDKALKVAYKQDTLPAGDPNFQPGVRFAYNAPEYSPSYSTSPFANVTPYGSYAPPSQASSGFSFGSNLSKTNPPQAPVQPVTIPPQNTNPIPVPGLNNNQTPPLTLPYIPVDPPAGTTKPAEKETFVEPIASIFVQPHSVSKGARVLVSWAGLGVGTKQPCTVTAENTAGQLIIAERNEGSRSIVATSTGLMKFTIQCTTPSGASLQRSETVMVL